MKGPNLAMMDGVKDIVLNYDFCDLCDFCDMKCLVLADYFVGYAWWDSGARAPVSRNAVPGLPRHGRNDSGFHSKSHPE